MCAQSRSMEMWTAALKWAMDFDSIVNMHNIAVAADAEAASADTKSPVADDALALRSPAAATPMTPRQFSLARDSLTIPLDDDVCARACFTSAPTALTLSVRCCSSCARSAAA